MHTTLNLRKFPTSLKAKIDHMVVNEKTSAKATQTTVAVKLIKLGLKHFKK